MADLLNADKSSTSWLTSAAPLIGAGLNFVTGLGSSLFNANQARKNRAFQERMYNKQVADNIRLWNMQNEYNLPKNVLARMEEAGINPLAYFNSQGTSLTSSSVAQGGNAPSGDSARAMMNVDFQRAMSETALINAQIRNIDADTEQKLQSSEESWTRVDWYKSTKGIMASILNKNNDKLSYEITQIATSTNALASITWKQLEVMDKGMEMLDKNYNLSERDLEARIAYNLATIALGNRQVDATLKKISVDMYNAVTNRKLAISEIAKNTAEIKEILSRKDLNEAEKQKRVNEIIHGKMQNLLYGHYGVDDLSSMTGALMLITGNIFPDSQEKDFQEVRDMYKKYGIEF